MAGGRSTGGKPSRLRGLTDTPFGGPITENVKDVLVTGLGGLLGLMTGLTIAFLGSRNARQAERDRNKREDLYRFAADRQAAFARLLAAGDSARTATYAAANDPTKPNLTRASENVDQVTSAQDVAVLLGSERVNRAIDEYAEALVDYYNLMDEFAGLTPAGRQKGLEGTKWKKAEARVYDYREEALRLMREDLQIVPRRVIPRARRPGI